MAIESLFDRGDLDDWKEFARAMRADPSIAERALRVAEYREPDGSEGIARALVERFGPTDPPPGPNTRSCSSPP